MQLLRREAPLRSAVKRGLNRLVRAARPRRRFTLGWRARHWGWGPSPFATGAAPSATAAIDPVALTVMAVNRLGPATLRTVANGKPVTVRVPNARIGEIFRAALAEMQRTRLTDRLIAVVVDDATDATGAPARS